MEALLQPGAEQPAPWILQTHGSGLVEQVLEYRFLSELTAELLRRGERFEVLRGDFDLDGHDLVIEACGVMRHIQLKAMVQGGRTASVPINTRLAAKPSACVIWMNYDPDSLAITAWRWFGGPAGKPMQNLGDRKARHSRANAQGVKAERPGVRILPAGKFERITDMSELADRLFDRRQGDLLRRHLAAREPDSSLQGWLRSAQAGDFSSIPNDLDWDRSLDLAMLVDGYGLVEELGLGVAVDYEGVQLAHAQATGRWSGGAAELWATLFLEHRRWKFSEPFQPGPDMSRLLDTLVSQLQRALVQIER